MRQRDAVAADAAHPWPRPTDPDQLHQFLREQLGVRVPRTPLIRGHAAPFDYLLHAYFDGRVPLRPDPQGPVDAVVWANRGGGKTFLGAVATALDLLFKPGIQVRILAGSLEQAKRMHTYLRELFDRPALSAMLAARPTERRLRLINGSAAELLAQSQASVRGTRVQKLRCDEVELFDPELWEAAQLVTRSRQCGEVWVPGSVECLSTMHVPYGVMYRIVSEAREGRRRLFRWGVVDVLDHCDDRHVCQSDRGACALWAECRGRAKRRAPGQAGHVDIDDAIRMKHRVALATWEAEMLSLRPRRTDAVLPEFDPAVHVVDELPADRDGWRWVAGMDLGYRAPTVVLFAAVDPAGVLWVVDEHVASGLVLDQHAAAIRSARWPAVEWVGVDPAGRQVSGQTGSSDVAALRRAGLQVRDRLLPVAEGIALIRARLRPACGPAPRLMIHRRCQRLIRSLERYHYPPGRPESLEPVKDGSDHAVDALRYLVVNLDRPHRSQMSWYV